MTDEWAVLWTGSDNIINRSLAKWDFGMGSNHDGLGDEPESRR